MTKEEIVAMAKEAFDRGDMIEAGYILKVVRYTPDRATPIQREIMRMAFFKGAKFMLDSMTVADDAAEKDVLAMINNLRNELNKFADDCNEQAAKLSKH